MVSDQREMNERTAFRWIKRPDYNSRKEVNVHYHRYKLSNIELDELMNRSKRFQEETERSVFKINYRAYLVCRLSVSPIHFQKM